MDNKFIRAEDVAQELNVSKPYAYKLIRQLNEELRAKGYITISGRVNRQYFYAASKGKFFFCLPDFRNVNFQKFLWSFWIVIHNSDFQNPFISKFC